MVSTGRRGRRDRRERLVIAWSQNPGRPRALADTVDGAALTLYPRVLGGRSTIARYAASSLLTLVEILRRRPRVVIVQNPVVFPALIAWCWTTATRGTLILDSHPSSFGAKNNRQGRLMLPVSRWLSRRARATLVTVQSYVDLLDRWGARGLIVHEPPIDVAPARPGMREGSRPTAFFPMIFAEDEPAAVVAEVARRMPDVDFVVTGRPERCPVPEAERPDNWVMPGFVPLEDFLGRMAAADVVVSLTDDETSVARSGYEATYLEVPLIVSDVPSMVQAFQHAPACGSTADQIVETLRAVLDDPPSTQHLESAREAQLDRWERQRAALLEVCGPAAHLSSN